MEVKQRRMVESDWKAEKKDNDQGDGMGSPPPAFFAPSIHFCLLFLHLVSCAFIQEHSRLNCKFSAAGLVKLLPPSQGCWARCSGDHGILSIALLSTHNAMLLPVRRKSC